MDQPRNNVRVFKVAERKKADMNERCERYTAGPNILVVVRPEHVRRYR